VSDAEAAVLIVAGWAVLVVLAVGWVAWATRGSTPTDPIDDEWSQLCDDEAAK
jgi:hypothetical protein